MPIAVGLGLDISLGQRFGSSEWAPSAVGTVLWDFDARNAVLSGSLVTSVTDASGNGYTATAPGGSEPTYNASVAGFNNKPTITFPDAGTKVLDTANALGVAIGTSAVTILMVANCAVAAGNRYALMTKGGGTLGFYAVPASTTWRAYANADIAFGTAGVATAQIQVCRYNGAGTSVAYQSRRTGANVAVGAHNISQGFRLGNWQTAAGGNALGGDITRVIVWSGDIGDSNVGAALDALGLIYGVSIAA